MAEPLQSRDEGDRFRDAPESKRRIEADFSSGKLDRGIAAGEPFELDARLRGKDGIYRWFPARCNPLSEDVRAR